MSIWKDIRNWWVEAVPQDEPIEVLRGDDGIQPLYFVMHPNHKFSVAVPQPELFGKSSFLFGRGIGWWDFGWDPDTTFGVKVSSRPKAEVKKLADRAAVTAEMQLKWLLSQAPMLDVPKELLRQRHFLAHVSTGYAYIHPKTFAEIAGSSFDATVREFYGRITSSSAKWIVTSWMPEDRVILSPNLMPGFLKLIQESQFPFGIKANL